MFVKLFKIMSLFLLLTTVLFAEYNYKYMGSFKAGDGISGLRSEQYDNNGLEYDFVVEKYGIVEFKPNEPTNNTVQYKITDIDKISGSYFYVGYAEGITSHTSLTYPDGWKIAMMPGTYKIIVYTQDYEDNPEKSYGMDTVFTPSTLQSPETGTTFNPSVVGTGLLHSPASIVVNETYYDNIAFYRNKTEEINSGHSIKNEMDYFSFSLSKESSVTLVTKLSRDSTTDPLDFVIQTTEGIDKCSGFYTSSTTEKRADSCTLSAGDYLLKVGYTTVHNEYEFKLESTPTTVESSCSTFSLERDEQQISLKIEDVNYFNIKVCDPVTIQSSDESVVLATRSQGEFSDEVELKAIADGTATITVSDSSGSVGHLYVTVGDGIATPITTPDTKQEIGNITFLEYEPDGYFSWSDADKFCKERGYRLPTMDELIYVWDVGGKTISPEGFKKDTFYWASEASSSVVDSYQSCAMDVDCSQEGAWPADSNGHPKCVVSVNGSTEVDGGIEAKYDDFSVLYCGVYSSVAEGLQVNGTSSRYGNYLRSKKTYDVRDSVTKIKWKAHSSSYASFSPTIVSITGGGMTTDHSFAGSSKIESDTWYYTTMSVSGDKATTITAKNGYATTGSDVVDSREHEFSATKEALSKNGVQIGFTMGDNYASTSAYFIVSEISTTAKEVGKSIEKTIELQGNVADLFSNVVGSWSFSNSQLQIVGAKLGDTFTLDVSNVNGIILKAKSKQDQSNFYVKTLDASSNIISSLTVDASVGECFKEYYLATTPDVTQVEFIFTTDASIEHYESQYKDVYIKDLKLQYSTNETPSSVDTGYTVVDFEVVDNGDAKEVKVDMGDKKPMITMPPSSDVFKNDNGGITTITPETLETRTTTTLNSNGTFMSEIGKLLGEIAQRTRVLIDLVIEYAKVNSDGSDEVKAILGDFILNLTTDVSAKITPSYSMKGKEVVMPTFSSGSRVYVTTHANDVIIEVQTKLTSKIVFQR